MADLLVATVQKDGYVCCLDCQLSSMDHTDDSLMKYYDMDMLKGYDLVGHNNNISPIDVHT